MYFSLEKMPRLIYLNFFFFLAKYETPSHVLEKELHQLGLPKEHSSSICKVYAKVQNDLNQSLVEQSLLSDLRCKGDDFSFEYLKASGKVICSIKNR